MKTIEQIRKDLEHIKEYYTHKDMIGDSKNVIHPKNFSQTLELYTQAISHAPHQLQKIYNGLYIRTLTQKCLSLEMDVAENYIQILNKKLLLFLEQSIWEK